MMTIVCSETSTLVRWFKIGCFSAAAACLAPLSGAASDIAATKLGQGINAYSVHDYGAAIQSLRGVETQIPRLADYALYYRASAEALSGDTDAAARDLSAYRAAPAAGSPLAGKLALLGARVLLDQKQPAANAKALDLLQTNYKLLAQPDGDFALGLAYEAVGEKLQAALSYEKVYYASPNTALAAQSSTAMERLREALGKDFPTAPARQQLERCEKWLDAKEFAKARLEFASLAESLPEPNRDEARVGIGATDFLAGDSSAAMKYLKGLKVSRSEADAERLYYLTEAARRQSDDIAMMDAVKQLNEHHADSPWRLKALITAGNRWVTTNDRDNYEPLFKAASDKFPSDSSTAYCHWKLAWDSYVSDKSDRADLLREQISRYPGDSRAGTALYFLAASPKKTADIRKRDLITTGSARSIHIIITARSRASGYRTRKWPPRAPMKRSPPGLRKWRGRSIATSPQPNRMPRPACALTAPVF